MKRDKDTISYERLHEVLHYEPDTGVFTWKEMRNSNAIAGQVAGYRRRNGYVAISVDKRTYIAHRLAWLYVHGFFPENQIDHINHIRHDNKLINLREVSQQCNSRNCNISKNNISGVNGVCWRSDTCKWIASIKIDYKRKHIGPYKDIEDAVCARLAAEQCLGWEGCDSTSSAYLYVKRMLDR